MTRGFILNQVKKKTKISDSKLSTKFYDRFKKKISAQTVRRVIKNNDYYSRIATKKPYINKINRKKRFNFANEYIHRNSYF